MAENPAAVPAMGINAAFAIVAAAAGSDAGNQHLVTNFDIAYAAANFFYHPQAFVAKNASRCYRRHVAFENV